MNTVQIAGDSREPVGSEGASLKRTDKKYDDDEEPLRSELFNAVQMEEYGRILAASHRLKPGHAPDRLLARLTGNEHILVDVCSLLLSAAAAKLRIAPAGEWLLDNFYLIEEHIRIAKRHLPKGYSRELPRLLGGPSAGLPRVYDLALEIIAHGDSRVDPESLSRFVAAYQTVGSLKLGELWAIPIMLRLSLIENLRRVAIRIADRRNKQNLAGGWADKMVATAERDPKNLILVIADMARSEPPMSSAFVAELARRLQTRGSSLALPLTWMEQQLAGSEQTIERLVEMENRQQAADQVSVSNSIGSLRFLAELDWREFVETMSAVENTLRGDPDGVYGRMEFATRDRYRHSVEKIAKRSGLSENEVARLAVELARAAPADAGGPAVHVGFYPAGRGSALLNRKAKGRQGTIEPPRTGSRSLPLFLYAGAIMLLTALFTWLLMVTVEPDGLPGPLFALVVIMATVSGLLYGLLF